MQEKEGQGAPLQIEIENARKEGYRAGYCSGFIDGEVKEAQTQKRIKQLKGEDNLDDARTEKVVGGFLITGVKVR